MIAPSRVVVATCAVVASFAVAPRASAVPITVRYADGAGEGFNDSVLGPARRAALEFAVGYWADALVGDVPIVVAAAMDQLGGAGDNALLGSTRAVTVHTDFPGAPQANTWYGAALANELSGADLNGSDLAEIQTTFNTDVDNATVLGSVNWYYGTDAQAGADIDFVTIALHELGHGLNFFSVVNPGDGSLPEDTPGIFESFVVRPGVGSFSNIRDAERFAALTSGAVFWDGPYVLAMHGTLTPLYAPSGFEPGSTLSHWATSLGAELMSPFYRAPTHDPGLLLPALLDMGWQLSGGQPSPVASFTPTPSPTPTLTPPPTLPRAHRRVVYVTNFGDSTVSVIDGATYRVTATIPVGAGPVGLAASPDGALVCTANFQDGSVSVLDTRTNTVIATIEAGGSPNSIAIAPDGRIALVTNTDENTVGVMSLASRRLIDLIPVGEQPTGIATTPDGGFALVTNFGGDSVSVIDLRLRTTTATIRLSGLGPMGPLGIAVSPNGSSAVVAVLFSQAIIPINLSTLRAGAATAVPDFESPEAVATGGDGARAYAVAHRTTSRLGTLVIFDTNRNEVLGTFAVGHDPEALALTAEGDVVYVANTADDTLSVLLPLERTPFVRTVARVNVGASPMGVAVAAPPACSGDCDGDDQVTVDELLRGVGIVLGRAPVSVCPAADADGNGEVTVDELIAAVTRALSGCIGREPAAGPLAVQ